MGEAIVELASLTHRYGQRTALDRVSLSVAPGCIFGLLGPNGGGKTTLFRILATLMVPAGGSATITGLDVVRERARVRSRIGIVFQQPSLDGKLTVLENIVHQGHLYGLSGCGLRQRAGELLDRFGLSDRLGDRAEELSGGLQRRVELAKALLHKPAVLILDEPGAGLDPAARTALMDGLTELKNREGVTSLLTTHILDDAERCDRLAILDLGRMVADGVPAELRATVGGDVIVMTCRDPDGMAQQVRARFGLSADVIEGAVRIERQKGHEFVPQLVEAFPGEIESVSVGKPTLDDVFLHLTGHRLWDAVAPSERTPRSRA